MWCFCRGCLYVIHVSVYVCCSTIPEGVRDQLLMTISKTFHCAAERAEQIFVELMLCTRKKHLVS